MPLDEFFFHAEDGVRLYSRVYAGPAPTAPVVVCLHGLMRNSRDFEDLAPHLARTRRVLVPDVRGRGLSARDPHSANYQIPRYLRDLELLLTALGVQRMALVGTSMGGLMGMMFAAVHPQRVTHLVLNDVGPEIDPVGLQRIRSYAGKGPPVRDWAGAVAQLQSLFGTAWPGLDAAQWMRQARRSYREDGSGTPLADADPRIGDVLRESAGAAPDLWPMWATATQVPILVLRGALSDVLSEATVSRMTRSPRVQAVTVANRGHVPLLDEPECLAAVDAFLATG
jgi:pimeloyl-ACP methyl ester carboxylesterase